MNKTIWIVKGRTGVGTSYTTWMVDAWSSREDALDRIGFLNTKIRELRLLPDASGFHDHNQKSKAVAKMQEFDEDFEIDHNGTTYYIDNIVLKS